MYYIYQKHYYLRSYPHSGHVGIKIKKNQKLSCSLQGVGVFRHGRHVMPKSHMTACFRGPHGEQIVVSAALHNHFL